MEFMAYMFLIDHLMTIVNMTPSILEEYNTPTPLNPLSSLDL